KTLYTTERPSFIELEEHVRRVKAPAPQATEEDA
ncbi:TPA: flagellar motor stator protein MotA, partial [Yersinia enterocolitica]|nr:flagellar motor stator protein MotA [Yersinia enterocolitica]